MEQHVQFGQVSNMTKVEVYKWTVVDRPGEFRLIDKSMLRVDRSYQRDHTAHRSKQMARAFSWTACGALSVVYRDGVYYIIDGQHRYEAALVRADIKELPCMVFPIETVQEEAKGFLDTNTLHRQPRMIERFRAMLKLGDKNAVFVNDLINSSGYSIATSSHGRSIKCVGAMIKCAQLNVEALEFIWPLVVQVSEGRPVHERILQGLHYIQCHTDGLQDYRDGVINAGYEGLLTAANNAMSFYTTGGPKIWAKGMLEAINKRRRKRLQFTNASD